jgi:pseudolysin
MHPTVYLSPLIVSLALKMASSAKAAEPLALQKESFKSLQQYFKVTLPGAKKLRTPGVDALQFVQQHTDKNQITHIRLQQQYAGFPVIGGYAIVHSVSRAKDLLGSSQDASMNGVIYRRLQQDLGQASADFAAGGKVALNALKAKYQTKDISNEQVMPVVYIDEQHTAHWAYRVSIFVRHMDNIPEKPTAIVEAETNKVFVQWNDIKTARVPAKGMGFGGNRKIGEFTYGKNYPLLDISRDNQFSTCFMVNQSVKVVDMKHHYESDNNPMRFSCKRAIDGTLTFWTGYKGNGYDRNNGAYSPSNDALYAGDVIEHMYYDWYGVKALVRDDGSPMQLIMRVHYGKGYENAYWDGEQMTFGDGESMLYPLVSLGIASHEISHGFTEQHANLQYFGQSGGMNESFSDMAAQAAEFYSTGTNNWLIGAEILKEESGLNALRYMDMPSRDGISIDRADQYFSGLGVHYSSGVYNRLFYILANKSNWDTRKAFDVMVKANIDYWTPYSKFDEGGCGVLSAAKDLNYSVEDIKDSLSQVAIRYQQCIL